ncbi:MAG: GMC family oxidoreductase [Actinomycetes bacterium]
MAYDVVVVGGGTAGCVMAARLSEDPGRRVLLVEAGPDYPRTADLPADVADASEPTIGHDWGFVSDGDALGRPVPLPRARLMGGCSATNGAFFMRGWPADYDAWAASGNPGWSFAELLPTLRAVEADSDFGDSWHGTAGPIPVWRPRIDELAPLQRAFLDSATGAGYPALEDHNRPGGEGVGPTPRNVRDGVRMSTALTHLDPARPRPNLTVRADAVVDRVEVSGTAVRGVRLVGGELEAADRVVLTAGAYASPAVLMRSGIGRATWLHDAEVAPVLDLPGVGGNLSDHPLVAVDLPTTPGFQGPRFQVMLTCRSSRCAADAPPDQHVFAAGPFDDPASPSGGVFGVVTALLAPRARGSVRLRSNDPTDPPRIDAPLLSHDEDRARMVDATLLARRLSRTSPLRDFVRGPELAPGPAIVDDDVAGLTRSIQSRVAPYHHPVGTCAMGPDPQAGAVVDARGAVYGVDGLWVADASVIPVVPSAGTNLTTIVVAARIADWLATT